MADVFLSYKRADEARAAQVATLLKKEGWTVWWDSHLAAGERWDATIEREINAARCVIVIWSTSSIDGTQAYWVHLEAHHGRQRGILVPVIFEGVTQPFAFSLLQGRDLTHWDGASQQDAAAGLIADVKGILERSGRSQQPQPAPGAGVAQLGGEAEREWRELDLDACRDPGLLIRYAGKWEKGDPVRAYSASQKAAALTLGHRSKGNSDTGKSGGKLRDESGEDTRKPERPSKRAGKADTTRRRRSTFHRGENSSASKTNYSLHFLESVENAAKAALASYFYIRQKHKISQSFSGDLVRQLYYPNSYFFLFRESTSVTNIQYAELYSLLKDGIKSNNEKTDCLIFHSGKELRKDLEALWYSSVCQLDSFSNYCILSTKHDKNAKEKQDELKYFKKSVEDIKAIYFTAYENQTRHTILIEPFANSCCVALPPEIELDVNFIVGQSGYIHSCGEAIYIRSFPKAEVTDLVSNLKLVHQGIVDKYGTKGERAAPVKFCIFSHDDSLSQNPEIMQDFESSSLQNIKLYRHKNFIGTTPIADLAEAMNIVDPNFSDKYFVISSYLTSSQGLQYYNNHYAGFDRLPCTVFLVKDHSISWNAEPTFHQYYICYLQTAKNENPFLRFDEDKPGWLSPVTTPHSLACAMINLARRALSFSQESPIILWDPFCATGTIPLEAAKLGSNVKVIASDRLDAARQVVADNLAIYTSLCKPPPQKEPVAYTAERKYTELSVDSLISILDSIDLRNGFELVDRSFARSRLTDTEPVSRIIYWAYLNIRNIIESAIDGGIYSRDKPIAIFSDLHALRGFDLFSHKYFTYLLEPENSKKYWLHRFIIYLIWRSALLNIGEFIRRDQREIANLIQLEIESKKKRFYKIRDIYLLPKKLPADDQSESEYFEVRQGRYSLCATFNPSILDSWWKGNVDIICGSKVGDILEVGKKIHNQVDLIITDPPYGFNVAIGSPDEQLKFYKKLIGTFLQTVKNFGQIIIGLPDESISGQSVPFYLRKAWILRELFIQIAELYPGEGRIIEISSTKPRYGTLLYAPPYYWRSKKALTRTVMHVVVQKSTCRCQDHAVKMEFCHD